MANSFLPDYTKGCLPADDARNREELERYLERISSRHADEDIVQGRVLGRLLRVIQTRLDLKYEMDDSLRSLVLNVLLDTYKNKRCAIPLKTRLLNVAGRLCKNKRHDIKFSSPFDWAYHWEELISVCTRSKKYEEVASEVVLGKLLQSQVAFMHIARRFISDEEADHIVKRAMHQLRDTRCSSSVEGVFLLVICLPTGFTGYDRYVEEWLAMWSRIEHNSTWDASWLTLLCRARKIIGVYHAFDWKLAFPFLLTKTKELLHLPGPVPDRPSNAAAYPASIPGHYLFLSTTSPFDARKTALHKVAKLLYFQCFYSFNGAPLDIVTAHPLPISPSAPDGAEQVTIPGLNAPSESIVGARDLATFYGSIRVYFHPSNTGTWSQDLGFLLGTQIGELARHVGREIAIKHGNVIGKYLDSLVRLPLHESTAQYLIGLFSSLLLEMLYSKNVVLSHIAAHGLKNLAPLSPSLCTAILPALVGTLDPSAVSKSHMALPAMAAISITFKSFLFPEPVILRYLPAILHLALPGIDPNDTRKTLMALNMYCKILSWVPIGETSTLIESKESCLLDLALNKEKVRTAAANSAPFFENTKAALLEWAPAFVDRMLALLDATEDANQHTPDDAGAKSRRRHRSGSDRQKRRGDHLLSHIDEVFRLFFAAIPRYSSLVDDICDKVLTHLRSINPLHAAKEYTALISGMVASHSKRLLGKLLSAIIDNSLRSGECSSEKLAFRLHLAGGAVRRATSTELLRIQELGGVAQSPTQFLKPYLSQNFSVKYPDIRVQEAARKLVRDLLRGLSATYPLEVSPAPSTREQIILGETSPSKSSVVPWHVPSVEGIQAAAEMLSVYCNDVLSSVIDIASGNSKLTKKFAEESLIAYLGVIHACCRGAADILGENDSVVRQTTMEDEDCGDEGETFSILETGRRDIVTACGNPVVSSQLMRTREDVVQMLLRLYDILNSHDEKKMLPADFYCDYKCIETSNSSGLALTPDIAALWLRVFEAAVIHRTWYKDPIPGKHSFSANKRQSTNSTARYAKRVIERFGNHELSSCSISDDSGASYTNSVYWERYDLPYSASSDRGFIQFGLIAKEYGHSAIRSATHASVSVGGKLSIFMSCFNRLVLMCGHDFESVRQDAVHSFQKAAGLGWKLEELIEPLVQNLKFGGVSYPVAAGTLAVLSCPLVMKKMVSRWPLMQSFLDAVPGTNSAFSAVDDMDKRQRLVESFSGVFVKYVDRWSHLPLMSIATGRDALSERDSASDFLRKILSEAIRLAPPISPELGVLVPMVTKTGSDSSIDIIIDSGVTNPAVSSGIRHEMYIAYVVMCLVGHRDIDIPEEAWIWAIRQVCTRRGHPVANIGMAILTRLAYAAAISAVPDNANAPEKRNGLMPSVTVPAVFLEILNSEAVWRALLEGLSSIGMKKVDESAQWSSGIDRMLRSADYVLQGFPRWSTNNSFLNKTAGGVFRPVDASLIMCLLVIHPSMLSFQKISPILEASKRLESTNEDEAKGHNTLRANLFGALTRLIQASYVVDSPETAELRAIDSLLNDFLFEQVQVVSLKYCYDWADALTFGYSAVPVKLDSAGLIPPAILQNTRAVLESLHAAKLIGGGESDRNNSTAGDDGFARHAKYLLMARGLLNADLSAVCSFDSENFHGLSASRGTAYRHHFRPVHAISSTIFSLRHHDAKTIIASSSSEVAVKLMKLILKESCYFVSSYRNIRLEIVEILSMLSNAHLEKSTSELEQVVSILISAADIRKIAETDTDALATDGVEAVSKEKAHNAIETAILWLELVMGSSLYRNSGVVEKLLTIALIGSGCADIDLAKRCHNTSLRASALIARGIYSPAGELSRWPNSDKFSAVDIFDEILRCFLRHCDNGSWRVRATAVLATGLLLVCNWTNMSLAERKDCKTAFNNAFYDSKPEIQLLGRTGMTAYLSTKFISELGDLSSAYTKNNDIFAAREKKKKKAALASGQTNGKDEGDKVDDVYVTTIFMSAAMLAAFPYDLPSFMPSLLLSLLRHLSVPFFHDTVTRTVQDFKRTHQDRWEDEFKGKFTSEQLDDLQGAGAQTYFT